MAYTENSSRKPLHMRLREPEYENMPRCLITKSKSEPGAFAAGAPKRTAHGCGAIAHACEFLFPQAAQFGRLEHRRHDFAAMVGGFE